ncbi:MAG: hypothetical protein ACFFD4_11300 [Candidatus Odinarchaeota archaeon]
MTYEKTYFLFGSFLRIPYPTGLISRVHVEKLLTVPFLLDKAGHASKLSQAAPVNRLVAGMPSGRSDGSKKIRFHVENGLETATTRLHERCSCYCQDRTTALLFIKIP